MRRRFSQDWACPLAPAPHAVLAPCGCGGARIYIELSVPGCHFAHGSGVDGSQPATRERCGEAPAGAPSGGLGDMPTCWPMGLGWLLRRA